ncbi:MAG: hypothetical protein ACLQVG_27665 [Terriglobia bacterium]
MSRSYRKPYAAVTGTGSAKEDKVRAARGMRHVQNCHLRKIFKYDLLDQILIPHRLECSWNEVYGWTRDGKQHLHFPTPRPGAPGDTWRAEYTDRYWVKLRRK